MTDRISPTQIPISCPRCGHGVWWAYRLIDTAPACGCGRCGLGFLLTEPLRDSMVDASLPRTPNGVD